MLMKRYLVFALVGPFVGGFLLLLTITYQSGYWTQTSLGEVGKLFVVFFKTLQYSYLFGFLPSLMIGAVDDILSHVRRLGPAARMLLVGLIAFVVAAFTYGSRGADVGAVQWVLYGMVGFIPSVISSWLVHRYIDDPQPVTAAG
jgi:hypothetical protein